MSKKATIYTDGGARGNPGPAGIGAVITLAGKQHLFKKYIGEPTTHQAEYQAVILALEEAKRLGVDEVAFFLDSELVAEQLNRRYKVKHPELQPLFLKAWNLAQSFKKITYSHVPRGQNKRADTLVNQAIDEQIG